MANVERNAKVLEALGLNSNTLQLGRGGCSGVLRVRKERPTVEKVERVQRVQRAPTRFVPGADRLAQAEAAAASPRPGGYSNRPGQDPSAPRPR